MGARPGGKGGDGGGVGALPGGVGGGDGGGVDLDGAGKRGAGGVCSRSPGRVPVVKAVTHPRFRAGAPGHPRPNPGIMGLGLLPRPP